MKYSEFEELAGIKDTAYKKLVEQVRENPLAHKLVKESKDLDPEIAKVVNKRIWEIL